MQWRMRRICPLTRRQTLIRYGLACLAPCMLGMTAAWYGYWPMAAFVTVEGFLLGMLALRYAASATDRERVVIDEETLKVELDLQGDHTTHVLFAPLVNVVYPSVSGLVLLSYAGQLVELGRFVPARERQQLADSVRTAVRRTAVRNALAIHA